MEKIYQVSEAAEALETEVYTLRYWENQLGLEVPRNAAGHRYYEEPQILMFRNVKRLKEAGFGLRQIKAMGERMGAVAALTDEKLQELRKRIVSLETEKWTKEQKPFRILFFPAEIGEVMATLSFQWKPGQKRKKPKIIPG